MHLTDSFSPFFSFFFFSFFGIFLHPCHWLHLPHCFVWEFFCLQKFRKFCSLCFQVWMLAQKATHSYSLSAYPVTKSFSIVVPCFECSCFYFEGRGLNFYCFAPQVCSEWLLSMHICLLITALVQIYRGPAQVGSVYTSLRLPLRPQLQFGKISPKRIKTISLIFCTFSDLD